MKTIVERSGLLEKLGWRGLQLTLVVFAAVIVAGCMMNSELPPAQTNEEIAEEIRPPATVGVNIQRKRRIELDINLEALLTLRDVRGNPRVGIGVRKDGALGLALFDNQGATRVGLGAGRDGALGLALYDVHGNSLVWVGASKDGALGWGISCDNIKRFATLSGE